MTFVIAQMQHETNTFSPVPTPWEAFGNHGPLLGEAAGQAMRGTNFAMAAFLDLARDAGAAFVKTATGFHPSGGATIADVRLMRVVVGPHIGVKASGGIRNLADARTMLDAGANRLGTSASAAILAALDE